MQEAIETDSLKRRNAIYRVTIVGSIGNLLLLIFKFVAGIVGHSQAMIADAVHSCSDFATDVVVLFFVRISSRPSDSDHRFGHGKYETLATAVIALALMGVGLGILWNSSNEIWRYAHGQELQSPGMIALVAAVLSIGIKEALYRYTIAAGRRLHSKAVEANAWHHRSDALSSIGTTVGIGGAILLGPSWRVLDPIAAVVVSLFILKVSFELLKPALDELLEKSLPAGTEQQIMDAVKEVEGITDPHNLRTRRIGNYASVELHVRVDGNMTVHKSHEITKVIERKILGVVGPDSYVIVHTEPIK